MGAIDVLFWGSMSPNPDSSSQAFQVQHKGDGPGSYVLHDPDPLASAEWVKQRYLERGRPVVVLARWKGKGPRNVLIRRESGELVVRPFRGLRRA